MDPEIPRGGKSLANLRHRFATRLLALESQGERWTKRVATPVAPTGSKPVVSYANNAGVFGGHGRSVRTAGHPWNFDSRPTRKRHFSNRVGIASLGQGGPHVAEHLQNSSRWTKPRGCPDPDTRSDQGPAIGIHRSLVVSQVAMFLSSATEQDDRKSTCRSPQAPNSW